MHLDSFANPLPTIDLTLFTLIVRIIGLLIIPKRASCGELRARVFPLQIAVDWRAGPHPGPEKDYKAFRPWIICVVDAERKVRDGSLPTVDMEDGTRAPATAEPTALVGGNWLVLVLGAPIDNPAPSTRMIRSGYAVPRLAPRSPEQPAGPLKVSRVSARCVPMCRKERHLVRLCQLRSLLNSAACQDGSVDNSG